MVMIMVVGLMGFAAEVVEGQGWWETVVGDAGIATMHAAVTHLGSVVLLDRTNIGPSQLALPTGVCRDNPADRVGCMPYLLVRLGFTCTSVQVYAPSVEEISAKESLSHSSQSLGSKLGE